MIKMNVTVGSDLLQQLAARIPGMFGQKVAPATGAAFDASAHLIQDTWRDWAMGGSLKGIQNIKNPSPRLAASIKIRRMGAFDSSIESDSPHAQRIQDGTPELDMKTTHPYGPKSRVSKDGMPYLIVPFRWGTPNKEGGARAHWNNVIPQEYFSVVEAFKVSKMLGYQDKKTGDIVGETHTEPNYGGQDVVRSEYAWGDRLNEAEGNARGMVRMAGKGGYFTFRVISALQLVTKPYSWIRPAVEAVDVVGAVENTTRPMVEDLIQSGLEADFGI